MSEFVTRVGPTPFFGNFERRIRTLRDEVLVEGSRILRREEEFSIRARWFRSGATLASLREQFIEEGESKKYQLFPTALSRRGAPYPLFGEYGTGRAGAATGRPAPAGYRYGSRAGMAARRFSRIAVANAKPQIDSMAQQKLQRFAANVTLT